MDLFWTALIVGLVAGIAQWDVYGWGNTQISRPIVLGMIMGFVLGDVKTGLLVGGTVELIYLGLIGVGASIPPDRTMATSIATSFAILSGIKPEAATVLAVPVAVASQSLQMLVWTINIGIMHRGDVYARNGDMKAIERLTYFGSFLFFLQGFIPAFFAVLLGVNAVKYAIELVPTFVLDSLSVAGGMLPALGFAMLFTMMSTKKLLPYFIIGFALAAYFHANLLGVAVLGIGALMLHVNRMNERIAS